MSNRYSDIKAEKSARQSRYIAKVHSNDFAESGNRGSKLGRNRKSKAPLSAPSFSI